VKSLVLDLQAALLLLLTAGMRMPPTAVMFVCTSASRHRHYSCHTSGWICALAAAAHRWDEDAGHASHGSAAVHQLRLHVPAEGLGVLAQALHNAEVHTTTTHLRKMTIN
jgi:hypothetical protein